VTYFWIGKPVIHQSVHAFPGDAALATAAHSEIGGLQTFDSPYMVQLCGELRFGLAFGRLSYAVKRSSHIIGPHRAAGHARCNRISLGLWPSLHGFHHREGCTRSFVRPLLRYDATVRLPVSLAHRYTPIGFSMRSASLALQQATEDDGISRFLSSVFVCVQRVCDRVGSRQPRHSGCPSAACYLFLQSRHPRPPAPLGTGHVFRGSMAGPHNPLSTLRPHPYEWVGMTRSRRR
jgi:hypothetical protein